MTNTSPFNDPGSGAGDKLPLGDLNGSLLLFTVKEEVTGIQTAFGPSDAVRCDVAVLDGNHKAEVFADTLIFPRVLSSQLRGSVGAKVLGRLGQGQAKAGQSPPWILSAATEDDKEVGTKYLAYVATQQVQQPANAGSPF